MVTASDSVRSGRSAPSRWARSAGAILAVVALAGCGDDDAASLDDVTTTVATIGPAQDQGSGTDGGVGGDIEFPEVLEVAVESRGEGRYRVDATISSPYDSPERYADAFRVLDADGTVLGVRELTHDHASEQPFTRGFEVELPADVSEIVVEGRDLANGWGGGTATATVPAA